MAAPLTNFRAGGEDLSDIYVDSTTIEDLVGQQQLPFSLLSDEGKAALTNRSMWSWGLGTGGYLASNSTTSRSSPVQVGTLSDWYDVSFNIPALALKSNGTLWVWGPTTPATGAVVSGVLGLNDTISRSSPTQIGTSGDWAILGDSGSRSGFAIKSNGTLWGWGSPNQGVLGLSDNIYRSSPVQIGTLTNWKGISAFQSFVQQPLAPPNFNRIVKSSALAVKTDGTLWAWGSNVISTVNFPTGSTSYTPDGNLGLNNTNIFYSSPVQVGALTNWKEVILNGSTTVALKTDGTIWSWGRGNIGLNSSVDARSSPVQIGTDTDWKFLKPGAAIKTNGSLWVWGSSTTGGLGLGDTIFRSSPVQVGNLNDWKYVELGSPSLAIKTDGTLWGWGSNTNGGLGVNDTISRSSPIQIGTLSGWRKVSARFALR